MLSNSKIIPYCGRFAPSPTGSLHFGSLVTAVGSYLQARTNQGKWLLRIEDLDRTRYDPHAIEHILSLLDACCLHWDHDVYIQQQHTQHYQRTLDMLDQSNHTYYCSCTRKGVAAIAKKGHYGFIYPDTCRYTGPQKNTFKNIRLKTDDHMIEFCDQLQGVVRQQIHREVGDFSLKRLTDHSFTYQLAVVVDDEQQQMTEIVRGTDLLFITPRQIFLQQLLGFKTPHYLHLPIAVNKQRQKLSKQTHAPALPRDKANIFLFQALEFLRQAPPITLQKASSQEIIDWALHHWRLEPLKMIKEIKVSQESAGYVVDTA